jgi:outer membrane lipoprotein-sorting protein
MKKSIAISIIAFLMLAAGNAQEMKLDDILNAYYKATGIEKMKDWSTLTEKGKTIVQGMEFPFTMITKRPSKLRVEAEVQGNKMIQCFDGSRGWNVVPWSGSSTPQDMTPDDIKNMKEQADMEGALYNWKEKGHQAELIGKEDMEGSSAYKIKVSKANGDIDNYFIDAENYILLKTSSKVKIQGNETENESLYTNYKDINGVLLAETITTKIKDQTVSQIMIEKVEINQAINDSIFVKPVVKK